MWETARETASLYSEIIVSSLAKRTLLILPARASSSPPDNLSCNDWSLSSRSSCSEDFADFVFLIFLMLSVKNLIYSIAM